MPSRTSPTDAGARGEDQPDKDMWANVYGRLLFVSSAWDSARDSLGHNGYDVAAYLSDGVSIWPCGRTVDAKEQRGTECCRCFTCQTVRKRMRIPTD